MSIAINNNPERDQLVANAGQVLFAYSFPVMDELYMTVYKRGANVAPNDQTQKLTLGVDYTIQGLGQEAGGTITLVVPAANGDIITIVGTEPIERVSVFDDLNPLTVALNQQLNEITIMLQQSYTYWNNMTPHYNYDELVSARFPSNPNGVRPDKLILPMLPNGHVWVGRGEIGDNPDDIVTAFFGGAGSGNVISTGNPMRKSLAVWTGIGTQITDSYVDLNGATFDKTPDTTEDRIEISDDWAAFHWPSHVTAGRPATPVNGDTYYDTSFNQFFGYLNGVWTPFATGDGNSNLWTTIIPQPGHTLTPGALVYQDQADGLFKLLDARTVAKAEIQGMVVEPAPVNPNEFLLQFAGKVDFSTWTAAPTWASAMAATKGLVYFASDSVPGEGTLTPPTVNGETNLPVFLTHSATAGVLRHSRGLIVGGTPPISGTETTPNTVTKTIPQTAHGFAVSDWIYAQAYDVPNSEVQYAKGDSSALVSSHVDGVVIQVIDANHFVIQEGGICNGVVNTANNAPGSAIASGGVYYLSNTVPGKLMSAPPGTIGHYAVRCFAVEQLALDDPGTSIDSGYIMDKRPIIISAPSGSGALVLIDTYTINNGDTIIDLSNVLDGTLYTDAIFRGVNVVARRVLPSPDINAYDWFFQMAIGGVVQTSIDYVPNQQGMDPKNLFTHRASGIPVIIGNGRPNYPSLFSSDADHGLNFEIYLFAYRQTQRKLTRLSDQAWSGGNVALPVWQSKFNESTGVTDLGGTIPNSQYYWDGANQNPVTGLYFKFNPQTNLPAGVTFELISGTIEVYGVL